MKKGMLFDLYQECSHTRRVMAVNETDVIDLDTLEIIKDIDFEYEVEKILLYNIIEYPN